MVAGPFLSTYKQIFVNNVLIGSKVNKVGKSINQERVVQSCTSPLRLMESYLKVGTDDDNKGNKTNLK